MVGQRCEPGRTGLTKRSWSGGRRVQELRHAPSATTRAVSTAWWIITYFENHVRMPTPSASSSFKRAAICALYKRPTPRLGRDGEAGADNARPVLHDMQAEPLLSGNLRGQPDPVIVH